MMEDNLIERKFGKTMPFKVPDGYFERFEAGIMDKIPECAVKPRRRVSGRYLRIASWAACIAFTVIVSIFYFNSRADKREHVAKAQTESWSQTVSSDYMIDEMTDYVMLDNDDLYSFIADE